MITELFEKAPGYLAQYRLSFKAFLDAGKPDLAIKAEERFLSIAESQPDVAARYFTSTELMEHRAQLAGHYMQNSDWVNAARHLSKLEALNVPMKFDDRPLSELLNEVREKIKSMK